MTTAQRRIRGALVAGGGLVLIALLAIALRCRYDATVPFLPGAPGATWIVYPVPPQTWGRSNLEIDCAFRRAFDLATVPASATLELRAFRRASVAVNGKALASARAAQDSWKTPERFDVAAYLRPGRNELAVVVSNDKGPPALWLRLDAGSAGVATDTNWETSVAGATWERARLAGAPGGTALGETPRASFRSLRDEAVPLLAFAFATLLLLGGAGYWRLVPALSTPRGPLIVFGALGLAWVLLFANDFRSLPMSSGFDVAAHLDYVKHVRERKALPLATEGWEMYQPPLYYVVSAAALGLTGAAPGDALGKAALRSVTLLAGLAQLAFILASLRLLFPRRPRAQLAGGLLAAFVPVHLYLYQYATNEALAATLGSASIYLGLRVLADERPSPRLLALLGGALGAALLTKLTALLILPAMLVALGSALFARGRTDARAWLTTLGIPLAVCLTVCGWYYLRVWSHFGSPFIGNWDERVGVSWWQDPGFRTAPYFLRFGRSLAEPFFAGFHGLLDGLYSTFWGDGLWGGAPNAMARPPWNYELMRAGYLVAVAPMLLIVVGLIAGVAALWRRPQAHGLLLAGLAATTGLALIAMTLKVPSYAQVKAFYVLPAIVPICAAAGLGFDRVALRSRIGGALFAVALGVWALGAYASFWIRPSAPQTLTSLGVEKVLGDKAAEAVPILTRAVASDPSNANARFWLGYALYETGKPAASIEQGRKAVELDPAHTKAAIGLAMGLDEDHRRDEAVAVMRRAVAASPDDPEALTQLGSLLQAQGATAEAIDTLRRAVGRKPDDMEAHYRLGRAYADAGRYDDAIAHLRFALRVAPGSAEARAALADALSAARR